MKHIKESSVEQLNLKYKNKKIYCVGCGKRLFELIELYSSEPFINNISGLFDNNSKLWDVEKEIGSIKLKIENPVSIKQLSDVVILITSDHYEDIFKSIQEYLCNKNVYVFRYPQYYYRWTGKLLKFFSYMPLSRQILFYAGAEPHENADAIVSYLNKEYKGKKYSIVYLSDIENFSYNGIKYIYSKTVRCRANFFEVFDYCRLYSRSKFLCYENQALKKVSSKQCLIYLNHGTIPLKNVSDVLRQPEELDIGVCPGKGCANFYIDQYGITPEKQVYMMPARVNRMFKSEGKIHDLLKIDHKKVVLWLPTFRQLKGSERKDSASLNPIELLKNNIYEIDEYLSNKNIALVIKKHPREKVDLIIPDKIKNIFIIRDEQLGDARMCLQDLLNDTVALLTDYSGISFEYMLLGKPIGYVLTDINEYHRGFSVDNPEEYMPGTHIFNKTQFLNFIDDVVSGKDEFYNKRVRLIEKLFGNEAYENGAAKFIDYLDRR